MADEIKLGDQVQLKSGGPVMTVAFLSTYDSNSLTCQWFDGTKIKSYEFQRHVLVKFKE